MRSVFKCQIIKEKKNLIIKDARRNNSGDQNDRIKPDFVLRLFVLIVIYAPLYNMCPYHPTDQDRFCVADYFT